MKPIDSMTKDEIRAEVAEMPGDVSPDGAIELNRAIRERWADLPRREYPYEQPRK